MVLDFPNILAIFCFFFALLYISWRTKIFHSFTKKKTLPPEVDGARPILGHLRLLGRGDIPLGRKLAAMADKYGAVFTLRLGMYRILVVSNWEAVKDCFTTNDKVMAARPDFAVGKYLGYNYAVFSLDTDSPYWRKMRKFAVTELLSSQKLEKLKHLRVTEVGTSLKELYMLVTSSPSAKTVDMNEWFRQLTLNLIVKIVAGKRFKFKVKEDDDCVDYKEAQHIIDVFKEFMYLNGQFVFGDAFPYWIVRWVEFQGRVVKDMGRIMKELDTILQRWVDEHVDARRRRGEAAASEAGKSDHHDFIDVMLSLIDDDFARGLAYPPEIIIKATGLSMIIDGSDTTAVHLTWLMSLIVNHADATKRIREEIESKVGKDNNRWVEDADVKDMEYLQAVVKETLRLYPPLPTYAPHAVTEDCKVGGYDIPKGTHLYVNAWKVHRDPRIWPEPDEFMPERFLTAAPPDAPWRNFEYIPFGGGRRSCIGNTYAMQVAHLTVARLIQGFDFVTPFNKPLDMSEGLGITLPRATPLNVVITPRMPPSFYGV